MKVWTIQTADVLRSLRRDGVWHANPPYIDEPWSNAYEWMSQQLAQRVGPSPHGVNTPVWVWRQWRNAERPIPDLRGRGHVPQGELGVRLELDIDPNRALFSDFEQWHYALNYWYLRARCVMASGSRSLSAHAA